jgi:ABC-2 type transport system permease protein
MLAIARKEFLHIIHDPRSLLIIFAMPIIQLVMFGYALDMEIKNVKGASFSMSLPITAVLMISSSSFWREKPRLS